MAVKEVKEENPTPQAAEVQAIPKEEAKADDSVILDGVDPIVYSGDETLEKEEEKEVEENAEKNVAPTEEEIDDTRFKGKSKKDIYKSYRELEGQMGHQSNELGMYRKLFDEKARATPVKSADDSEVSINEEQLLSELYEKPTVVLNRVKEDAKKEAKKEIMQEIQSNLASHSALSKLEQEHPDRVAIINGSEFQEWANKYVPSKVLNNGNQDPEIASFILSEYKRQMVLEKSKDETIKDIAVKRTMAAKAGVVNASSSQSQGKKIYSRLELGKMMMENPSQYAAMQPEIILAYQEGRVK